MKIKPQDLSGLKTYSLHDRYSKVNVDHFGKPLKENSSLRSFMNSLPDILLGHDFPELVQRLAKAHRAGRPIIMGMGAHVIKVGLNPLLIDLVITSYSIHYTKLYDKKHILPIGDNHGCKHSRIWTKRQR